MSNQALEQEFSLRQSLNDLWHSQPLRVLAMSGAVLYAATGCAGSPGTEVQTQEPGTSLTAGDGSTLPHPGTTDGTEPGTTTRATAVALPGPVNDAIRRFDFHNFTLEQRACENSAVTWPTKLVDGKASGTDRDHTLTVSLMDSVGITFADVDGDGVKEAEFAVECTDPGVANTLVTYAVQVYTMEANQPKLMGIVGEASGGAQDILRAKPYSIAVKDKKILINGQHFAKNDSAYKPTQEATTTWTWTGNTFRIDGTEITNSPATTTTAAQAETTTTAAEAQGGTLSKIVGIKGVGDIHPGMSQQDILDLGYTINPGCGSLLGINKGSIDMGVILDSNNKVSQIEVTDPNIVTLSGAGVGISLDELKTIYKDKGTLTRLSTTNGLDIWAYKSTAPEDAANWLLFVMSEGKVKWMTVAADGQGANITDC